MLLYYIIVIYEEEIMTTVQAVIPSALDADLAFVADKMHRSKSYLIWKKIKSYIAEKLEEIHDNRAADEALRVWKDTTMKNYSGDEVRALLRAKSYEE